MDSTTLKNLTTPLSAGLFVPEYARLIDSKMTTSKRHQHRFVAATRCTNPFHDVDAGVKTLLTQMTTHEREVYERSRCDSSTLRMLRSSILFFRRHRDIVYDIGEFLKHAERPPYVYVYPDRFIKVRRSKQVLPDQCEVEIRHELHWINETNRRRNQEQIGDRIYHKLEGGWALPREERVAYYVTPNTNTWMNFNGTEKYRCSDMWQYKRAREASPQIYADYSRYDGSIKLMKQSVRAHALFPDNINVNHHFVAPNLVPMIDQVIDRLTGEASEIDWQMHIARGVMCLTNLLQNYDRPRTVLASIGQYLLSYNIASNVVNSVVNFVKSHLMAIFDWIQTFPATVVKPFVQRVFGHTGIDTMFQGTTAETFVNFLKDMGGSIDLSGILPRIGAVASLLISVCVMQRLPGGNKFETTFNRFAKLSGVIRSIGDITALGSKFFSTVTDSVYLFVFGVERAKMNEWKNIDDWVKEVQALIVPDFENVIKGNLKMKQKVESLIPRGHAILRFLDGLRVPFAERSSVTDAMLFLNRVRETAGNCGAGQTKPRIAPPIIHFFGNSGVGKSTTLWALIAELQAALGCSDPSDLHEKTYFRRPGGDFWDGYNSAMNVVVCDDFGARKDTEQNPSPEFLEAIHMSNTAFWQLNMAELSEKRNTYFQAKCVLWTSNRSHFDVNSLTNPEAVIRRIDLKIRQRPHPNFAKEDVQEGKTVLILDDAKVNKAIQKHGRAAMLDCVVFDLVDKLDPNDRVLQADLRFRDVAKLCVELMQRKIAYFEDFHETLNDHIVDAIDRSKNGWTPPPLTAFDPATFKVTAHHGSCKKNVREKLMEMKFLKAPGTLEDFLLNCPRQSKWNYVGYNYIHFCPKNMGFWHFDLPTELTEKWFDPIECAEDTDAEVALVEGCVHDGCFEMEYKHAAKFYYVWKKVEEIYASDDYTRLTRRLALTSSILNEPMEPCEIHQRLYIQVSRSLFGEIVPVSRKAICDQTDHVDQYSYADLRKSLERTRKALKRWVVNFFDANPYILHLVTGTIVSVGSIFSMVFSIWIGEKLMNWLWPPKKKEKKTNSKAQQRSISPEIYADDRTRSRKTIKTEKYDTDRTTGRKNVMVEMCSTSRTGDMCDLPEMHYHERCQFNNEADFYLYRDLHLQAETYDQDRTQARKVIRTEVERFSDPIPPVSVVQAQKQEERRLLAQAVTDQNAKEVVDVVIRNMYKLEYRDDDIWKHALNLTVVKGRLCIVNRHLKPLIAEHTQWRIRNHLFVEGIEFNMQECAFGELPDGPYGEHDVMMFELPRVVQQHPDITSKFMTAGDFSRFSSLKQISAIGYVPGTQQDKIVLRQYFGSDVLTSDHPISLVGSNGNDLLTIRKVFMYNIQSTPGDCGSVLCAFDRNFNNKIFGIHCGGAFDVRFTGYGTPVNQGLLKALEADLTMMNAEGSVGPRMDWSRSALKLTAETVDDSLVWSVESPVTGNFLVLDKADRQAFSPSTSKIVPSPVHGMLQEPITAPAPLKPFKVNGHFVDPMRNARAKASPIARELNRDILSECAYNFFQTIDTPSDDKHVLSYEEAITGREADECYPPMKRSTSPGYGWDKKGKGKTAWLGSDGEYDTSNLALRAKYCELLDTCLAGQRPTTVWTDTLKDERRPLEKVEAGKTRLFSCGEMAFTILFRQYFAGFIAHMTRNRIRFESCVGVNVYSNDWTRIVMTLREVGDKVIAGDFTNYDGTLHPEILWEFLERVDAWYAGPAVDSLVRRMIWSEIVNSVHLVGDTFYMWNHSQPSGCPMTTILNCGYHSISARYVFMICALRYCPTLSSLLNFRRYVRHVNYGDDDVWAIADEIVEWFNQKTISEAYRELGMTYTDEAKSTELTPFRKLSEINFLKRTFRWDESQCRYRAPLALSTILEMAMWNHGSVDQHELTATVMENAVMELAQHDRRTFDEHFGKFERCSRVLRIKPMYLTYNGYQLQEALKLV